LQLTEETWMILTYFDKIRKQKFGILHLIGEMTWRSCCQEVEGRDSAGRRGPVLQTTVRRSRKMFQFDNLSVLALLKSVYIYAFVTCLQLGNLIVKRNILPNLTYWKSACVCPFETSLRLRNSVAKHNIFTY